MTQKDILKILSSQNLYVKIPNFDGKNRFVVDNKDTKPNDNLNFNFDKFNKLQNMLNSLQNLKIKSQQEQANNLNNEYLKTLIKTQQLKNKMLNTEINLLNNRTKSNNNILKQSINFDDNDLLNKFAQIESGNRNLGPNSSGYEGIFQFRFRKGDLGKYYLDKMGITYEQWKNNPQYQRQMMQMALNDYKKDLSRNNIAVNPLTLYMVHNQGLAGTKAILNTLNNGKPLSRRIRLNVLNQFGYSEKKKYNLENVDDLTLAKLYVNKFRKKLGL